MLDAFYLKFVVLHPWGKFCRFNDVLEIKASFVKTFWVFINKVYNCLQTILLEGLRLHVSSLHNSLVVAELLQIFLINDLRKIWVEVWVHKRVVGHFEQATSVEIEGRLGDLIILEAGSLQEDFL